MYNSFNHMIKTKQESREQLLREINKTGTELAGIFKNLENKASRTYQDNYRPADNFSTYNDQNKENNQDRSHNTASTKKIKDYFLDGSDQELEDYDIEDAETIEAKKRIDDILKKMG